MIWSHAKPKRPLKEFNGTLPGASNRIFQNQELHYVGLLTVRGGGSATVVSGLFGAEYCIYGGYVKELKAGAC